MKELVIYKCALLFNHTICCPAGFSGYFDLMLFPSNVLYHLFFLNPEAKVSKDCLMTLYNTYGIILR